VAGIFYPQEKRPLEDLVDRLADRRKKKEKALAAIVPHGGYVTSGAVAGEVYSRMEWPSVVVIVGPNHTGLGEPWSIMTKGTWVTPLGSLSIDEKLARSILENVPELKEDPLAHRYEHSIEVQLPFIQRTGKVLGFVPIVLKAGDVAAAQRIGKGLGLAIRQEKTQALLIVSTDLTQYEPQEKAKAKDRLAIEQILHLDEAGLLKTVEKHEISMCGSFSTAMGIATAKELGATQGTLVRYSTSGESSGDYGSVVGYAGVLLQ